MNRKSILMSSLLLLGSLTASAQEDKDYEYVFNPHWYVGVQGGVQYTLGEADFSDLLSPNAQVLVGYNFNKVLGLRLGVNAWQSKAGLRGKYAHGTETTAFECQWKYKYVAPNLDVTVNLSNLTCGYNPHRLVNVGLFVGIGANIGFGNNEANDISAELLAKYPNWAGADGQNIHYLWSGSKVKLQGRGGLMVDFRVAEKVMVGLEANANVLNDRYNSKKAENADWYFNALAGVKVALGKTYIQREIAKPEPVVIEKVVERVVEKPVEKIVDRTVAEPMRLDVFFTISSTSLVKSEEAKVREIAQYLTKHPGTKVEITGYADKGTGSADGNLKLSEKRAVIVTEALKSLGISEDRISSSTFKGDTEQPFDINELNRVSICVVK